MNKAEIKQVASIAQGRVNAVLGHWVPGGKREGNEYLPLNPKRADSKPGSFSINVRTGAWSDFATGDKGGDLVGFVAYLEGVPQGEAAKILANFLGIDVAKNGSPGRVKNTQNSTVEGQSDSDGWVYVTSISDNAPEPPARHYKHGTPTYRYAYHAIEGAVCFYHDRYEFGDGKRKQFAPLTLWEKDGCFEWRFKALQGLRSLYGLPSLIQHPDAPVWLVEGEKTAAALSQLHPHHPILTWQGGAQAVTKSDYTALSQRDCVIFRDNDEPGLKAQQSLIKQLQAVGVSSIQVLAVDQLALQPGWIGENDTRKATLSAGEPFMSRGDAADLLASGWQAEHFALFLERDGVLLDVDLTEIKPKTATDKKESGKQQNRVTQRRFELRDDGVYVSEQAKNGDWSQRYICEWLEVKALVSTLDGREWGKLVEFVDPDKRSKQLVILQPHFNGEGLAATGELLAEGLVIAPKCRQLVLEYLQTTETGKRAFTTNRTGWHGELDEMTFVLPHLATGAGDARWIYSNQLPDANPYRKRGTLKQWRENVALLCGGNSRLVFAVSTAFASPLLRLIGSESGGFHFRGGSSSGKSTALYLAASVLGGRDYLQRWRGTDNGIEALAQSRSDALLILDEIKQLDGRVAAEAAYMLGNGCGKVRANPNGGARSQANWLLLYLSSGEISLSQHVADAGKRMNTGAEIRLCDIPADAGVGMGVFEDIHGFVSPDKFADALVENAAKYCGTAFTEFIQCLLPKQQEVISELRKCEREFSSSSLTGQASGQARRVASRFALVAAAGELATDWGMTGWEKGEAIRSADACFKAWLAGFGGESDQEERAMIRQVTHFIELHSEGRFVDIGRSVVNDDHAPKVLNKFGFRKHTGQGDETTTEYFITTEVFKNEVCKGFDYRQVARALIKRGYMRGDGKHLQPKVTLPGEGCIRVFHVLPAIREYEND